MLWITEQCKAEIGYVQRTADCGIQKNDVLPLSFFLNKAWNALLRLITCPLILLVLTLMQIAHTSVQKTRWKMSVGVPRGQGLDGRCRIHHPISRMTFTASKELWSHEQKMADFKSHTYKDAHWAPAFKMNGNVNRWFFPHSIDLLGVRDGKKERVKGWGKQRWI